MSGSGVTPGAPEGEPYAGVLESHLSVVLLIGGLAYKVKKPLTLPFVDLGTRAARREVCEAELRLNRRLAPDVYLDVAELQAPHLPDLAGEPVLVMRRMPHARRLSALLGTGEDLRPVLTAIARAVAALHAGEPPVLDADLVETTASLWQEGHDQLRRFAGAVLPAAALAELEDLSTAYLAGRRDLLAARERAGLVRDGHGDLLTDDVFCLPDGPRILDCLEFDRRLRVNDVLADVAFLAMDLRARGAPEAAAFFVDRYREFTDEHHPHSLEHHYVAYRAFVRLKVECLQAEQGQPGAAERARALLPLAVERSRAAQVHLVLLGGLPGSGKSTVAARLVGDTTGDRVADDERDWVLLSSDAVRRDLFGGGGRSAGPRAVDAGHYDAAHGRATYTELLHRAGTALRAGACVVLDASWSSPEERDRAATLAADCAATLTPVLCRAPLHVCAARLAARRDTHGSDADVAVLEAMAEREHPWPQAHQLVTTGTPQEAADAVRRLLEPPASPA